VRIRAVDKSDPTNILYETSVTDLIIGDKYSTTAPFIDNTWVLSGDLIREITIAQGTNDIIFEYDKIDGNVTIILREV
jgi:hypothetical protein